MVFWAVTPVQPETVVLTSVTESIAVVGVLPHMIVTWFEVFEPEMFPLPATVQR
jgi:hypothetical protein